MFGQSLEKPWQIYTFGWNLSVFPLPCGNKRWAMPQTEASEEALVEMGQLRDTHKAVSFCQENTQNGDECFWVSFSADEMLPTLLAKLLKKFLPRQLQYIN
jgi:hypothetical protein